MEGDLQTKDSKGTKNNETERVSSALRSKNNLETPLMEPEEGLLAG
jgi:hypothetical protein